MARPRKIAGRTAEARLPGEPSREELIAAILRVDQAGEYGALRIYEGQLAVLGSRPGSGAIRRMAEQERRHLEAFNRLVAERRVRPTALSPLWHIAGFALGAASASLGVKAAMAATVAVEEVIDAHYARQAEKLGEDEADLKRQIEEFRKDEIAHRDEAIRHGAEDAAGYAALTAAIRAGTRAAIWLSTRI